MTEESASFAKLGRYNLWLLTLQALEELDAGVEVWECVTLKTQRDSVGEIHSGGNIDF